MTTLLVDDEPLALQLLENYVQRHPELELAGQYTNPIDALQHLQREPVDLLLLDIQMPELNGLDLARLAPPTNSVILTTAYGEHALTGYDLDVVDYLLKPINFERFVRAVDRVVRRRGGEVAGEAIPPASLDTPFFIKSGHRTIRLDLNTLRYASSSGDYLELYLADDTKILILENLGDFCDRLPQGRFARIHRSHLVALQQIDFVERRRVVIGETWLPVSERYWEELTKRLGT